MKVKRRVSALLASMVAASACAQSAPSKLNLNLPPRSVASESASAGSAHGNDEKTTDATSTTVDASNTSAMPTQTTTARTQSGVRHEGSDGLIENAEASAAPKCDDATYAQPQVHGAMTMGVVAGNHFSGNYQAGGVTVSKAFGSCDHPTGGASISIDVGQGNFNGRRRGWR